MKITKDDFLASLSRARSSFYASGFQLPVHYLRAVEGMRKREAYESDYQYYLDEVLREQLVLPYPWQPLSRKMIPPEERSSYLETLSSRLESVHNPLSLDENFNLFKAVDDSVRLEFVHRFRSLKQEEMEKRAEQFPEVENKLRTLLDAISGIGATLGFFRGAAKVRDDFIDLVNDPAHPSSAYIRLVDLLSMEKRGHVTVQYFIPEISNNRLGLSLFVPGGYLYSEWNKSSRAVLFSFYTQCRFMADLVSDLGRHRL